EKAFLELVDRYHALMVRVARSVVGTNAVAEEVVQEAWIGVISGISRFEGRSSLKWWILRIVTNCAKTRSKNERRFVSWSAVAEAADDGDPAVNPERFLGDDHPRWPGGWASPPAQWGDEILVSTETLRLVERAISRLPPGQRQVIWMRDVEGLDAQQVCDLLGLTEANQRVLLHRARSRVRNELESYLQSEALSS
ncbi:MAG TPA: RNA polymerase sigma factor, partial [Polyangiaceae bacterium]